jgi:PAS domain S-box-containing protein
MNLSAEQIASLLDNINEAVIAVNHDHRIVYCNAAAEKIFGFRAHEIMGQPVDRLLPERLAEIHRRQTSECSAAHETNPLLGKRSGFIARRRDGAEFPVKIGLTKVVVGEEEFYTAIVADLTELARVEDALRQSDEKFHALIAHSSEAITLVDAQGIVFFASSAGERIFGIAHQEVLGRPVFKWVHPADLERARQAFDQLASEPGSMQAGEFRLHKDGMWCWIEAIGTNLLEVPAVHAIVINFRDVTERKQMEQALHEREERLRLITDNISDLITLIDLTGKRQYVSPAHTRLLGYPSEELLETSVLSLVHPEDLDRVSAALVEGLHTHTTQHAEFRVRHADGHYVWLEAIGKLLLDQQGSPLGAVISARDITEHKQRQREIEAIAIIATALRAAPGRAEMMPVILHEMIQIMHLDSAALVLRHASTGDLVYPIAVGDWADWTGQRELMGVGISDQVMRVRQPFFSTDTAADQRLVDVERFNQVRSVMCVPLLEGGQAFGALWIGHRAPHGFVNDELRWLTAIADIAANALHRAIVLETLEQRVAERTRELSEANERLRELDRLKDQFVSNVSHELRTPLANIKLYAGLLTHGKSEKLPHYLETLRRETLRLEKLIEDLLELSRLNAGTATISANPIDVNRLIESLIADRAKLVADRGLSLNMDLNPNLPYVLGDPWRLEQVLSNLLANAMHYTPQGGTIVLRTSLQENDHQAWATITVEDTGLGITAEELPLVFERFYRGTAGRQSGAPGTGLGLAICKELVDRLGGHITVESDPGHGTTFTVWLKPCDQ